MLMIKDIDVATIIKASVAMVASHKFINQQKPNPITLKIPITIPDVRQEMIAISAIKINGFGNNSTYSTLDRKYSRYEEINSNIPENEMLSQLTIASMAMPGDR